MFAQATSTCLCFWVLSYVDGATLVTITDKRCEREGRNYFSGILDSRNGVLSLTDSHRFRYLNVPVHPGQITFELWADVDKNPEWVWIRLGAIRAY